MNRVLYLVGATASGKKQVALAIRRTLNASLLSLDSMKVYRGMNRGTAKDAAHEFLLTDLVEPDSPFSVGDFVAHAALACREVWAAGKIPLFVGGTGLYLRAMVRGLCEVPAVAAATRRLVRERLAAEGGPALHRELGEVDPAAADRIHPNDHKRLGRALEVFLATGRALSDWQASTTTTPLPGPHAIVGIRWSREALRERITARVDQMLAGGLVDEVRALRQEGRLGPTAMEAIGYREVVELLEGRLDAEACRTAIIRSTWKFSRRQANWFGQFPEVSWVQAGPNRAQEVETRFRGVIGAG